MAGRAIVVQIVDNEGSARWAGRWPVAWLLLPVLVVAAFVALTAVTVVAYRKAGEKIEKYATLAAEAESLRRQNERLRILEAELTELRELQQQMLSLAGIETVMGVDLQLLEDLRESAPGDTAGVDPRLLVWPLSGDIVTPFSEEHPGIDIDAPRGQTVLSSGLGVVDETGTDRRYGRRVTVRHVDGWTTTYANLALHIVDVGDTVALGQVLGLVGVGREGPAPHLHFEVRRDGVPVPPGEVLTRQPR